MDPLITYSSPSRTARVLMPDTSEPASGSVIPSEEIFWPLIEGTRYSCFCSSVPNRNTGGVAMSVCTATPIARPPELDLVISSASTRLQ